MGLAPVRSAETIICPVAYCRSAFVYIRLYALDALPSVDRDQQDRAESPPAMTPMLAIRSRVAQTLVLLTSIAGLAGAQGSSPNRDILQGTVRGDSGVVTTASITV